MAANVKESMIKIHSLLFMETTNYGLGSWFVELEEENVGIQLGPQGRKTV